MNYLVGIGQEYGEAYHERIPGLSGRRLNLKTGVAVLRENDHVLSAAILDELETLPGVRIHGITDRDRLEERVPTVSFTWGDRHPRDIAAELGEQGILVWDGNYYALAVTKRLGLEGRGAWCALGRYITTLRRRFRDLETPCGEWSSEQVWLGGREGEPTVGRTATTLAQLTRQAFCRRARSMVS